MVSNVTKSRLPRNPISALHDPTWKMAMDDEFHALINNKTWELVPRPPHVNVIRSMWIFTHKVKSDGSFERHKACLVDDGKHNRLALIVGETFRPVVKPATIRTVLSLALSKAWQIHQLDVKKCFFARSDNSLFMYRVGSDVAYLLLLEFAMKDLGPLNYFLGIALTRHNGGLFLSQRKYAEEIIDRDELM
ncbi:uncharacterized protein LOC110699538 [Chenopodium quinoa]|uniref:uncharacterized protein LOC110699538 n=1 Tax=Chenopodium quinoa TaxID=63459 RepID=UPI000B76CACA|nr:uncharacterized protein LOC110699538 [Chenopodium quinoa]